MTVLAAPAGYDLSVGTRNRGLLHPELQFRLAQLELRLHARGMPILVTETFRYDVRQQWLYGSGRTVDELQAKGLPVAFARPAGPWLTNAWSAAVSAHGWTILDRDKGYVVPASAAVDLVPVGKDGRPWDADDPWDEFIELTESLAGTIGLHHWRDSKGCIEDRPHLEMTEYSNITHTLNLPEDPPPLMAA